MVLKCGLFSYETISGTNILMVS